MVLVFLFIGRFLWRTGRRPDPGGAGQRLGLGWFWFSFSLEGFCVLMPELSVVPQGRPTGDRKSTRLNSSHLVISYAVFCLKKNTFQLLRPFVCKWIGSSLRSFRIHEFGVKIMPTQRSSPRVAARSLVIAYGFFFFFKSPPTTDIYPLPQHPPPPI